MIELPPTLTAPVSEPSCSVRTNGELLETLLDYQLALRLCNGKLKALQQAYGQRSE